MKRLSGATHFASFCSLITIAVTLALGSVPLVSASELPRLERTVPAPGEFILIQLDKTKTLIPSELKVTSYHIRRAYRDSLVLVLDVKGSAENLDLEASLRPLSRSMSAPIQAFVDRSKGGLKTVSFIGSVHAIQTLEQGIQRGTLRPFFDDSILLTVKADRKIRFEASPIIQRQLSERLHFNCEFAADATVACSLPITSEIRELLRIAINWEADFRPQSKEAGLDVFYSEAYASALQGRDSLTRSGIWSLPVKLRFGLQPLSETSKGKLP